MNDRSATLSVEETPATKWLVTIHSQKGGVGKTLIALYLARKFAQDSDGHQGKPTVLVDADLTGTSLAEAIHLQAPHPEEGGFLTIEETRSCLRHVSTRPGDNTLWSAATVRKPNLLNDILFCDPLLYHQLVDDDTGPTGFKREHLLWRVEDPSADTFSRARGWTI
jgi:hypothetical protein